MVPTPGFKTSAGFLIDTSGLKGKKMGGTQISPHHANFILNLGNATAMDVLKLIDLMRKKGYKVKIHDPFVKDFKYNILDLEDAIKDSDCIIVVTDHSSFKNIKPEKISKLMKNKNLIDTRNMLDHKKWEKAGFNVEVL